jgi:putative ABC transport system permease protein
MFALVGIFGLVRHDVKQSTQDIGVRMALEATRYGILKMLLDRVGQMLCVGAVTGIILIVVTRKFIGMIIYFDLRTEMREIVCLALLLVITGLISVLMPAFRASSIEPTLALRTE